jgi:hypothetical protein
VTGVRFTGRRPPGAVFQAVGGIEKNWVRFAIYNYRLYLVFYQNIENRSVSPRNSAALVLLQLT